MSMVSCWCNGHPAAMTEWWERDGAPSRIKSECAVCTRTDGILIWVVARSLWLCPDHVHA